MKLFQIYISNINKTINFKSGSNANDNFIAIDSSNPKDLWFHVSNYPSAHIIAEITNDIEKKDLKYIIKRGAVICKQLSKYSNQKKLEITYTQISNVKKTDILGTVNIINQKNIII
jgi:predicted ribosome quality control (RQC) complex YloA/Tae2 family protein